MLRTVGIWLFGLLGSALVGGLLGAALAGSLGTLAGILAGLLLFACVRLWLAGPSKAKSKPPTPDKTKAWSVFWRELGEDFSAATSRPNKLVAAAEGALIVVLAPLAILVHAIERHWWLGAFFAAAVFVAWGYAVELRYHPQTLVERVVGYFVLPGDLVTERDLRPSDVLRRFSQ